MILLLKSYVQSLNPGQQTKVKPCINPTLIMRLYVFNHLHPDQTELKLNNIQTLHQTQKLHVFGNLHPGKQTK